MFKSARWRSDKNKIKLVFKLHFHATQVAGNALSVFVTPADMGKPTLRLEKVTAQEGACYWEKPIFETVKFGQDSKTGKINEKIYHFQVSDGSLKTGIIGEACIDFAEYVETVKSCSVSLPLKNSKSGAVLHVSIQKVQDNVDQREVEESEIAPVKGEEKSLRANSNNSDTNGSIHNKLIQDASCNKITLNNTGLNVNHRASSASDILSSSGSSSGFDTPRELALITTEIHHSPISSIPSPSPTNNHPPTVFQDHQRSQSEWSVGTDHGLSTDESTQDSQDTLPREGSSQASDMEIKKLKSDLLVLARRAEMSDLELQTIRKQIVKESKKGQDLFKEVVNLKKERDDLKEECERNMAFKKRQDEAKVKNKLQFERGDSLALFEELRQELDYEKDLNQNLCRQLQKTQESNAELILAVRDLDEMLERINDDELVHYKKTAASETARQLLESNSKYRSDDDEEQKELDELVKEHKVGDETCLLEQRVTDLCNEIQIYRRDKDELEMQLEQLALDYEILKQENHDISYKLQQSDLQDQLKMQFECSGSFAMMNELETQVETLQTELNKQSKELTDSFATITKLETYVVSLEEEMDKQTQGFEADLQAVMNAKVEQEQRAIRAEEALRANRFNNANTAARIQEEFKSLSTQMASTFDANEKLATKALTEANELRMQNNHLKEMLRKSNEELQLVKEGYEGMKLRENSAQTNAKACHLEQTLFEMKGEIERLTKENETCMGDLKNATQELDKMRCLKDQKDAMIENLQLQLDTLRAQYNELNSTTLEDELEKQKLQKHVFQLKSDLKKKEDTVSNTEKKLMDSNGRASLSNGLKTSPQNKKTVAESRETKEVANLRERIKLLEGQIKLKEAALDASTNSFLAKENDLQNKIQEVESRLEDLNQSTTSLRDYEIEKVAKGTERTTPNGNMPEEVSVTDKILSRVEISTTKSNPMLHKAGSKHEVNNIDETLTEMTLLKQRNVAMERELKEMQERYSEISLMFAEVEGERQQLVMTVRNLKNARKC